MGRKRRAAASLLLSAVLVLSSCTGSETADKPAAGESPEPDTSAPAPMRQRLRVMSFNIEYGGTGVAFSSVRKAVRAARADVVAVNEGYGNIARVARSLGWRYYDISTQIVSRLPLVTPPGNDGFEFPVGVPTTDGRAMYVEVSPGRVVAVINMHLPASAYSPFKIQKGASARQIRALERRERVPAVEAALRTAHRLIRDRVPTFMLGDFNSPSDLDWTRATVGLRTQVRYPLRWPAPAAVEAIGMVDSYRAVHPDPVTDPGLTWPASRPNVPGYNPGPDGQAADRIDLLFSGGPASATSSEVVGERGSGSDIVVRPWPTDHRAVVSEFTVTPAPEPALVSVRSRLVERGTSLVVDYSAPSSDAEAIVVDRGAEVDARTPRNGTVRIDTAPLEPGEHQVALVGSDGRTQARMAFWVKEPGTATRLRAGRRSFARGEGIALSWSNAPGNRNDWLGVYRRGGDPDTDSYLGWTYVGPQIVGSAVLDGALRDVQWPLRSGRYTAYLMKDDGYDVLARADFRVR